MKVTVKGNAHGDMILFVTLMHFYSAILVNSIESKEKQNIQKEACKKLRKNVF